MAWNVLILGGGFGGLYAARKLERALPPHAAKVTVVTDVNFMLYTPLLPGAAAGTLEPRHVVVPLREHLSRTDLLLGRVTGADPERKEVHVTTAEGEERTLGYDHLIVAVGAISRAPGIKRRVRLLVDWTVDLLFERDMSELGQLGHPPALELPDAEAATRQTVAR
jgi:NADH dehydrogenase FAD-containing subunit